MVSKHDGILEFPDSEANALGIPPTHPAYMDKYYYGVAQGVAEGLIAELKRLPDGHPSRAEIIEKARIALSVRIQLGEMTGLAQGIEIETAAIQLRIALDEHGTEL